MSFKNDPLIVRKENMKKIITAFLLILVAFAARAQSGIIRELSGTVEVKLPGSASFVPAKAGDQLNQETVISTGFKSTALVGVGSSLITVRPLTRLTLLEIRSSAGVETLNVNLQAGRVRVDVNPPAGTRTSMQVSSPIATASVRGTSFEFDTRNIYVSHGRVSFMGTQGKKPTQVNAGFSSRVEENGKAADPLTVKSSGLKPHGPAGTGSGSGASGVSDSFSGGIFSIKLEYADRL